MNYSIIKEPKSIITDNRLKPFSLQKIAAQNGNVYFKGNPCKRNHDGLRYTKGAACVRCIELKRKKSITPRQRSIANHNLSLEYAKSGKTTYVPEKPCKRGHLLRFINSNNCVECDKIIIARHKLSIKFSRIKKQYGLTKDQYLQLVKDQGSSCKICNLFIEDHFKLHIDHSHKTKKVRGLLCSRCNQGIGLLDHNSKLFYKAALYCDGC